MSNKTDLPIEKLRRINNMHKQDTEHHLKDRVYGWIIDRYTKNSRLFNFSDRFVWHGSVYVLPELLEYVLFFALFYFLGTLVYNKYGYSRLFMLFALLALWRINVMIGLMRKINTKLGEINGKTI